MQDWDPHIADGVATLWINRPAKRNAISLPMWRALPDLAATLAADRAVKLLVLRGRAGVFSGGADIEEFRTEYQTEAAALANHAAIQAGMEALERFPKPSVAVIEGPAIGAGLGLALACDLRLAALGSRFAITPAKLGLLYALGDIRRLVEAVGWSRAKLMLLTARQIDATIALDWGLVDLLAAPEQLEAELARLSDELRAAAPFTRTTLKQLFGLLRSGQKQESPETRALFAAGFAGPDFQEGYEAFRARRPPSFE